MIEAYTGRVVFFGMFARVTALKLANAADVASSLCVGHSQRLGPTAGGFAAGVIFPLRQSTDSVGRLRYSTLPRFSPANGSGNLLLTKQWRHLVQVTLSICITAPVCFPQAGKTTRGVLTCVRSRVEPELVNRSLIGTT